MTVPQESAKFHTTAITSSAFVCLLGVVVIIGWYLGSAFLVQLHPSLVPMQFNTALCFFLCGLAFFLSQVKWNKVSLALSILVFIIASLTLFEYILDINIGLDELFMEHEITVKTSHPGRMAPNTALCFGLSSIAIMLSRTKGEQSVIACTMFGSVTIGLAVMALFGYMFKEESGYGWAYLTRMALHTSIGFLILGTGLTALATSRIGQIIDSSSTNWWRVSHLFVLSFIVFLIDIQTSMAVPVGLLYLVVILISYFYHSWYTVQLLAITTSLLSILSLFYVPEEVDLVVVYFNHGVTVGSIWALAYFVLRIKDKEKELSDQSVVLKEQSDKLKLALDNSETGMWEWDINSNELVWDNQMKVLYGLDDSSFSGAYDAWSNGLHPDDKERSEEELGKAVSGEADFNTRFRIVWPNGEIHYLRATGLVLRNEFNEATRMVGFNWDITKGYEAELALKNYSQELETKNKELNEFSYIASHDLQEPINTMNAFSELLLKQYADKLDPTAKEYLTYVKGSGIRAKELISDLLDYNRLGRDRKLKEIDLNKLIKDVLSDLSAKINDANAEVVIDKLPTVVGYETELRQVFQNLISNAIKFTKPDVKPEVKIKFSKLVKMNQFSVSDNGIGIEEKYYDKIFAVFRRLHSKSEYPGTGIGLAHCKKIVEMHNGNIWVASEVGKGSTFHFSISTKLK